MHGKKMTCFLDVLFFFGLCSHEKWPVFWLFFGGCAVMKMTCCTNALDLNFGSQTFPLQNLRGFADRKIGRCWNQGFRKELGHTNLVCLCL